MNKKIFDDMTKKKFKITFGLIVSFIWCVITGFGCFIVDSNLLFGYIIMFLFGFIPMIFELIFNCYTY